MTVAHLYQIVSNQEMRQDHCEFCGSTFGGMETHHIKSLGSGGTEVRANKINLCRLKCHGKAQRYEIKPHQLIIIVARREKVSAIEVYKAIGLPAPENIEEIEALVKEEEKTPYTLEDLTSMLINTREKKNEIEFIEGFVIGEIVKRGQTYSWIASMIKRSVSYVRQRHKTYLAFPTEESREPSLDWTHHRIAAETDNPQKWIAVAAGAIDGKEMSTRELNRAIEQETVMNGDIPTEEEETERAKKNAQKVLTMIIRVFEKGGEPADWLRKEIFKLLSETQKKSA